MGIPAIFYDGGEAPTETSSLIKDVIFFLNVADSEEGALDIFGKLVSVLGERSLGIHDVGLSEINTYLKSKDSKGERSRDRIYYWHEAYKKWISSAPIAGGWFLLCRQLHLDGRWPNLRQRERSGQAEVLAVGIARCGKCIFEAMPMCFANWQRSARSTKIAFKVRTLTFRRQRNNHLARAEIRCECPLSTHSRPRRCSSRRSTSWNVDVEQWAVLLTAEDIGAAGAAARYPAVDRKLDRQCRVEFDVVRDLRCIDTEDLADGRARQDTALADPVISGAVGEDHVESNFIDAGVLAAVVLAISDSLRGTVIPPPRR